MADVKVQVNKLASNLYVERQSIRLEARGKTLKDSDTLQGLNLRTGSKLYVKDLGPQIGWSTVFLCEYAGPLAVYLWVYQRPWIFYGDVSGASYSTAAQYVNFFKRAFFSSSLFQFGHAFFKTKTKTMTCLFFSLYSVYSFIVALRPHVTQSIMLNDCMRRCLFIAFHMLQCHWWTSLKIAHIIGDSRLMWRTMYAIHCTHNHQLYKPTLDWPDLR